MSAMQGSSPPPLGVTPNFEHPEDVLKTINTISIILVIAAMAPLVAGRIYIRVCVTKVFYVEDCKCRARTCRGRVPDVPIGFCVVSWVLSTGYCLTGIFSGCITPPRLKHFLIVVVGAHGGGNHDWEVTKDNMIGFQQVPYISP